jgi:hypothetical protein
MAKMETKTRPNNKYDCVNKRLHPSVFYIDFVMASNHSSFYKKGDVKAKMMLSRDEDKK